MHEGHAHESLLEGYLELLQSGPHWMFEITLILIFDVLIGLVLWPLIKKAVHRHDREVHHTDDPALGEYLLEAEWLISNAEPRSGHVGHSEWQRRANAWYGNALEE